jgi:hypothetical protein
MVGFFIRLVSAIFQFCNFLIFSSPSLLCCLSFLGHSFCFRSRSTSVSHRQALQITPLELHFLCRYLNPYSPKHVVPCPTWFGLPGQLCASPNGYWLQHPNPGVDNCVTDHHLVLYLVLHTFHATSDWSNKHSLCNHNDHAIQCCQLQLLSALQRCRKS